MKRITIAIFSLLMALIATIPAMARAEDPGIFHIPRMDGITVDLPADSNSYPQMEISVAGKPVASFEELPTLDWIIECYIQALGGRTAIEKLSTRSCKGRLIHDLTSRTPPVHEVALIEAVAKVPDKWLFMVCNSGETARNGFDGQGSWRQDADCIELDQRLARSKLAYLLNPQGVLHMQDYFPGMVLRSKEIQRGCEVYAVESTGKDKAHYMLYFNVKTGLLTGMGYYWELKDYHNVDGVKFPFRIEMSRKGGSSTYIFDKMTHNVSVDDATFVMPDPVVVFDDTFQGIDDPKVLPMLKHLPFEHGGMNVPCRDGRFLYDLIIKNGYKRGLEIGTSNGYSTLWLGLAFRQTGGQVITIEVDRLSALEARRNFRTAGLDKVIDVRINDAFKEIPRIQGEFDFIFLDAWKPDYIKFFRILKDRVKPGGAFTAHNVISQGRAMREFLDAIKSDPDLETTIHKTSSAGISVSIVRRKK